MQRLGSIQVLRAIAANMVVVAHVIGLEARFYIEYQQYAGIVAKLGEWGVGCFFVISGFVITRAALREDWRTFAAARLFRIFPIYWFYLAITVVFVSFWQHETMTGSQLFASLFLLPNDNQIVPVAWTLVFEMYFYYVVAVLLAAGINLRFAYVLWAFLLLALNHLVRSSGIFGNLITLQFIAGGMLALFAGSALDKALRLIGFPPWIERIGDASYSLYLCHFLVIAALGRALFALAPNHGVAAGIACFLAANVVGLLSYQWIEKPLLDAIRRWRQTRRVTSASFPI